MKNELREATGETRPMPVRGEVTGRDDCSNGRSKGEFEGRCRLSILAHWRCLGCDLVTTGRIKRSPRHPAVVSWAKSQRRWGHTYRFIVALPVDLCGMRRCSRLVILPQTPAPGGPTRRRSPLVRRLPPTPHT